jgi:hypothetical protein
MKRSASTTDAAEQSVVDWVVQEARAVRLGPFSGYILQPGAARGASLTSAAVERVHQNPPLLRPPSHSPAPPCTTPYTSRTQGTTCVYSKKVEYLHNLVFRALETIHSKKQRERAAAADEEGGKRGGRQVRL